MSTATHDPTETERLLIKAQLLSADAVGEVLTIWFNDDETWACQAAGVIFEDETLDGLFRTLASITGGDA